MPELTTTPPSIALSDVEAKFIGLLRACSDWINATHPQPHPDRGGSPVDYNALCNDAAADGSSAGDPFVTTRIAGGWVRDKLLGLPSDDMDVSVSGMTGLNFALLFQDYLDQTKSTSAAQEEAASAMSRIAKISANPEQSKALETATANIFGLSIDFVNLRKEVYAGDSRIPTMTFGTPKEDADRRDICFNSLLYNINTGTVEDWTGKGLDDLHAGIVRTPLAPLTTFLDDPLRVLRCVRFASRFNYTLHPDIVACLTGEPQPGQSQHAHQPFADDPRTRDIPHGELLSQGRLMIRDALCKKVSRERVGVEVDKMMGGPYPLLAHALLHQLGLYELVFHAEGASRLRSATTHEPIDALPQGSSTTALQTSLLFDALSSQPKVSHLNVPLPLQPPPSVPSAVPADLHAVLDGGDDKESQKLLQVTAALLPFKDIETEAKKGKWVWVGENVLMQGLKLSRNITTAIHSVLRSISIFSSPQNISLATHTHFIPSLPSGIDISQPVLLALLLRDKTVQNPTLHLTWELALVASLVHDLRQAATTGTQVEGIMAQYASLVDQIRSRNLAQLALSPPLLDGKEITKALAIKPSKAVQFIQTALLIWQFDAAVEGGLEGMTEEERKQQAAEWLKRVWADGKVIPEGER